MDITIVYLQGGISEQILRRPGLQVPAIFL